MNTLFSEITIKKLKIKNRIVMPPMVTFDYLDENGLVTKEHVQYYEERAKGGIGLIIVEATCVSSNGRLADRQLRLWSDEYIEGVNQIAEACHKHNSKVLVQIHHAGLKSIKSASNDIIAPSDYEGTSDLDKNLISARALTIDEIHDLQRDFIDASVRAKKAGFDGIELHGAHGYLISQFLSPIINKRDDLYGGSILNRVRFATEIITGIRKAVGDDFIIACRMGFNEPDLQTSIKVAKEFERAGLDLLHVSFGMISPLESDPTDLPQVPEDFNYNAIVYGGTEIRKNINIPVIVVNGIKTPEQASYLIENNLADFTAIGRGLLVDAEWANKVAQNEAIKPCLDCKICLWFKSGKSCPGKKSKKKNS